MSRGGVKQGAGAVRKRQQISDSSKQMFIWVAGMSAVVGAALVVSWFVWQQIASKNQVIDAKNETVRILKANNEAAPQLRDNIKLLEANPDLAAAKANDDQKALQVILDALPAEPNSLAFGASLEQKLASGIDGLGITSLSVTSIGDSAATDTVEATASSGEVAAEKIDFTMTVESQGADALYELLSRFERSIRVINIDELRIERSSNNYSMRITGHGFYQYGRTIELTDKRLP